ncbi:MAG: ParA family protein [Gordonibacter sp.]|uniref:ParA family protein n=1 Tax=Gordonibacter sp. TaxID=1968902 RepID=UPI002B371386|nr:ParA family protein [Gordonibacter sp.]
MRVLTVSNFKGGVAKTTTATNLAVLCAQKGLRTLIIDLDPQASTSDYYDLYDEARDTCRSAIELLYDEAPVSECAHLTRIENLSAIPTTLNLIDQNELMLREQRLRFALDDAEGEYDVAIIDCAPSAKQLALCAYVATSGRGTIIVPVKLDSTVMRGTTSAVQAIEGIATKLRIPAPDWKILRTCVPGRMTRAEQTGAAVLDRFFSDHQFDTIIHQSAKVAEGSWEWKPIVEFDPECRPAQDYRALFEELGL